MSLESLAGYFTDFGSDVVIGAATVRGIFDDAYQDALGMGSSGPVLLCAAADVTSVTHGTALSIGGVGYTIVSKQPDGTGISRLVLQES